MASEHSFVLCDPLGGALAELTSASGKTLTFTRNSFAEVQATISHEDDAAFALWASLRDDGIPQLKCYRDGTLIFRGWLAPFQEACEETALMTLVFRSPFWRLMSATSPFGATFTQGDAGLIARALIEAHPMSRLNGFGTTEATKLRDRAYPAQANIGEAIVNLTEILDGFDFRERFHDGYYMASFDVFARLGIDRPDAKFEYGPGTLANVTSVQRTVQPPVNAVTCIGKDGLRVEVRDEASIDKYDEWPALRTLSDVVEAATLTDKARELIRPNPTRVVSFTPEPALAPSPWQDFDLGDTVGFYARRGAFVEDVRVRINGFSVVIDDSGYEAFAIEDPRTPGEEPSIVGAVEVEIVDLPSEVAA